MVRGRAQALQRPNRGGKRSDGNLIRVIRVYLWLITTDLRRLTLKGETQDYGHEIVGFDRFRQVSLEAGQ